MRVCVHTCVHLCMHAAASVSAAAVKNTCIAFWLCNQKSYATLRNRHKTHVCTCACMIQGPVTQDCLDIACLRPHEPVMLNVPSNDCTNSMVLLCKQLFLLGKLQMLTPHSNGCTHSMVLPNKQLFPLSKLCMTV